MTKAISMAIKLDQDIMVTHMCVKFGEDLTNSFQVFNNLRDVQTLGQPYMPPLCGGIKIQLNKCHNSCAHWVSLIVKYS